MQEFFPLSTIRNFIRAAVFELTVGESVGTKGRFDVRDVICLSEFEGDCLLEISDCLLSWKVVQLQWDGSIRVHHLRKDGIDNDWRHLGFRETG